MKSKPSNNLSTIQQFVLMLYYHITKLYNHPQIMPQALTTDLRKILTAIFIISIIGTTGHARMPIVLMSDFGLSNGTVSAMKGIILSVDQNAIITDLSHNIRAFDIHEASFELQQAMTSYPVGSIFVCVIDPGVGTARKSMVAKLKNGYFIVGPDNGIITYVANRYGIEEAREIDESTNKLHHASPFASSSHSKNVYAYTAARLSAGMTDFESIGPKLQQLVTFPDKAPQFDTNSISGSIVATDESFGNLWTNIDYNLLKKANFAIGKPVLIQFSRSKKIVFSSKVFFGRTYGDVAVGKPVAHINSLGNVVIALNQDNFAKKAKTKPGDIVTMRTLTH